MAVSRRRKTAQPKPMVEPWLAAALIADAKKAEDIKILDLRGVTSFTDYFIICTGTNPRQIQAIADEISLKLKQQGISPLHIEGYENAEWVLADYGDFIVHIFSRQARLYYDLERLWRQAKEIPFQPTPNPATSPAR